MREFRPRLTWLGMWSPCFGFFNLNWYLWRYPNRNFLIITLVRTTHPHNIADCFSFYSWLFLFSVQRDICLYIFRLFIITERRISSFSFPLGIALPPFGKAVSIERSGSEIVRQKMCLKQNHCNSTKSNDIICVALSSIDQTITIKFSFTLSAFAFDRVTCRSSKWLCHFNSRHMIFFSKKS